MNTIATRTIGYIKGPVGLRGEVSVKPFDVEAPWVKKLKSVVAVKNGQRIPLELAGSRWQGPKLVLRFKTITNRNQSEALQGFTLEALESDLPVLAEAEFYVETLIGLTATSKDSGETLGIVVDVLNSNDQDFLEVKSPKLAEPVLVPFNEHFVPQVDPEQKTLIIQGLDALFEEE